MRVAIVTTYRPRACGIAVFSGDLHCALLESQPSLDVGVVSIVRGTPSESPPEVVTTIRQDVASDYPAAAQELARRGTDVVLIEHEYGIFGGEAGEFVLGLTAELRMPVVVTLHTVLSDPSPQQAATLSALCRQAALVMVFTETARQMVVEQGLATADQVRVVPHGAPDVLNAVASAWTDRRSLPTVGLTQAANELGLDRLASRTVLSTFGLISASKGLELMIRALPPVVAARPDVLYLIAGQTHPEVVKHEGESYRLGLEQLVHELDLDEHVAFLDRFLSVDELAVLLARTDLYLTPYRSPRTDRLRCPHLRGGRRLPGGLHPLPLCGGPPRLRGRRARAVRRRPPAERGGAGPARHPRQAGRGRGSRLGGSVRTCPGPAWARSPSRCWPRPSTTSGHRPDGPGRS